MRLARWIFLIAGIYGVLVITPFYFLEDQISRNFPPAITHPDTYYGFVSVTLAWQIAFLVIAGNPLRLRPLMLPAMLEKAGYGMTMLVLFIQDRVAPPVVGLALVDFVVWGGLFLVAYLKTAGEK